MQDTSKNTIRWPERLFITGIDTDAGKSYATGWLALQMMEQGRDVITQKFVQTGNIDMSEDIQIHRDIMGIPMQRVDLIHLTAPVIFSYPASPELAARIDGKVLDTDIISKATYELSAIYDNVIIEGAGGLMVPLRPDYLCIDYIRDHKLPVVLVTNSKLGSINHTLLSLSAIANEKIPLFAIVYNPYYDKDIVISSDTRLFIKNWIASHFPEALFMEMPLF